MLKNALRRLHYLNRMRLSGILLASLGILIKIFELVIETHISQLLHEILSLLQILSVFVGLLLTFLAFEKDIDSFKDALRDYILPQHFANLPIMKTQFAYAIRELVDFYSKQHEGGYLPIMQDLETEIIINVLPNQEHQKYNIPTLSSGYSWIWFKFIISSSWIIQPLALGHKTVFDPCDFIDEVLVMSYKTYTDLFSWRNPRRVIYFPVATSIYVEEFLRKALASVRFLSAGGKGLEYRVSKWSEGKQISDPVIIPLEPLLENASAQEKDEVLKWVFSGIENRPVLLEQAREGVFEVYKVRDRQKLPELIYIDLSREAKSWWKITSVEEYVIPAKVVKKGDIIWDQQTFPYLFNRVATVKRLVFKKDRRAPIILRHDRPPELLCFPYLSDPAKIKVELIDGQSWVVEPIGLGSSFWFPGDIASFSWHDTLINELLLLAQQEVHNSS